MAFSHPYGEYNVETTINRWFSANLTANGIPTWMPSARVVFNYPETQLISGHSGHAFTLSHLGADVIESYQGRHVDDELGVLKEGIAEVNVWVSQSAAGGAVTQWSKQAGDMVSYLFVSARETEIVHAYGSVTVPTGIGALVRFNTPEQSTTTNPDPDNPDLIRRRYLLRYRWIERFSAS